MKYRYITVYQIRGLIHPPGKGNVEIYVMEGAGSVRAILTDKLDNYCYEIDRARSVGYLMLKGFVGQRESTDLRLEVETEIGRIRERRNKELDNSEILVFIAEGEAEADFSHPNRETDEYVLGFEIINKEKIIDYHSGQVNAALAALCLSAGHEDIEIRRMHGDVYLINELGKSVYSFKFSGSADAYISRHTTDEIINEAQNQTSILISKPSLARVYKLLVQAISRDNDELRRFMFGWSALEILINKVFSEYEKLFVQNLLGADPAGHTQRYFQRIRDIMKGKYRIVDKFIVIAACVGADLAEADIKDFVKIKKTRDALLHGELIDEKSLPISETVALLKKYIRRHINAKIA